MRRVVIVGNAGSGKSTLARKLGARLRIPVVSLDALAWEPGWAAIPTESLRARISAALAGDSWISEGNYAVVSFDLRLPHADLLIWVERPAWECMLRVLRRAVRSRFGSNEDLAEGCKERFDRRLWDRLRFIANFDRVNRPKIEAARRRYGPDVPVVRLRGDRSLAAFLASCG